MANIKPLFDRVLVKRLDREQKTSGGIIIPESAQEKTQFGSIVNVGTGRVLQDGSLRPLSFKEGDKVLFGKYSGTEVKLDGQEYLILKEDEVLAVLN